MKSMISQPIAAVNIAYLCTVYRLDLNHSNHCKSHNLCQGYYEHGTAHGICVQGRMHPRQQVDQGAAAKRTMGAHRRH